MIIKTLSLLKCTGWYLYRYFKININDFEKYLLDCTFDIIYTSKKLNVFKNRNVEVEEQSPDVVHKKNS